MRAQGPERHEPPFAVLERALRRAGAGTSSSSLARTAEAMRLEPNRMAGTLSVGLRSIAKRVIVTGVIEQRIVLIQTGEECWLVAHLGPEPVGALPWPERVGREFVFETPQERVSAATLPEVAARRLWEPHVKLVALYHPEVFPVPRFPLGISAIARSIRSSLQGQVTLCDMQLGATLEHVLEDLESQRPEIVGISATFGQYGLLKALLEQVPPRASGGPLIILGGSLAALNAAVLLELYPSILVAQGPGEMTMRDVISYWHGDLELDEVSGIRYCQHGGIRKSARAHNRDSSDFLPEIDLLEATLRLDGVMQLESSRGCTHACSFCPREHKGAWVAEVPSRLESLLGAVGETYEKFPHLSQKIFLVDEEFVGYRRDGSALERALDISHRLAAYRFRWETSARVDQIYRPDRDKAWHVDRMRFWTELRRNGLDRCLFGIESGVDSILQRFNKRTTAAQNGYALRLLTACGVPIRCTYITFDPLMSLEELVQSYWFQGRRDLLLRPATGLPLEELFTAVHDETFARKHATGQPVYSQISYMLVSMECLLGSPYLRKVEEAGLARELLPDMGRRNAMFREPLIGVMSDCSQRWIDRNFSFDYTLKGLEKVTNGEERAAIRRVRQLLKRSAYTLLGEMLVLATGNMSLAAGSRPVERLQAMVPEAARERLLERMDALFAALVEKVGIELEQSAHALLRERRQRVEEHAAVWRIRPSWELING